MSPDYLSYCFEKIIFQLLKLKDASIKLRGGNKKMDEEIT